MTVDVIVPVRRIHTLERLLWSFSLNSVRPDSVTLVSNEIDVAGLATFGLNVRVLRFASEYYPFGDLDAALRRNVGIWSSTATHILTFDDDQLAPRDLVASSIALMRETPFFWGHHRFLDFSAHTTAQVLLMSAEAGISRESPPNSWHSSRSAYAGLFGSDREFIMRAGAFDMAFAGRHGGEDQNLGKRLALLANGSDSIFVHEPPFAWHPTQNTDWDCSTHSNLCTGSHDLHPEKIGEVDVKRCARCPFYWVPVPDGPSTKPQIQFEPAHMQIHEETLPATTPSYLIGKIARGLDVSALDTARARFGSAYREYVERISAPDFAVSEELASFLYALCQTIRPQRILDLGSGFSSFIFRSYARDVAGVTVWTVDDDSTWLARTGNFLGAAGLSTERISLWSEYQRRPAQPVDLVFHDLGTMATRLSLLAAATNNCRVGGIVVLDDMHKEEYSPHARTLLDTSGFEYVDAREYTLDQFGRFAGVAGRSGGRVN
jgi:predicted O-methyltransferase YrrM